MNNFRTLVEEIILDEQRNLLTEKQGKMYSSYGEAINEAIKEISSTYGFAPKFVKSMSNSLKKLTTNVPPDEGINWVETKDYILLLDDKRNPSLFFLTNFYVNLNVEVSVFIYNKNGYFIYTIENQLSTYDIDGKKTQIRGK